MFVLYLLFGFLICTAAGTTPADPLRDIQADHSRPPRQWEILVAVAAWCVALVLWPLVLMLRSAYTLTRRRDS
ncbi:MAG: hypothetical protein JO362_14280 [Streptomycetaceae bacterium]|nr:hypothetical protein [Streptomycetaceae bacterium]